MKPIVDRIDDLRTKRGLTHEALCRLSGVSRGYLSNLKDRSKTRPSTTIRADHAVALARVLDVSVEYLVTGREVSPRQPADDDHERRAAVEAARALQVPEAAIERVLAEPARPDLSRVAWFRRIEAEAESLPRR